MFTGSRDQERSKAGAVTDFFVVEVFKFGLYMFFPVWIMFKFGDPEWSVGQLLYPILPVLIVVE
jgi:hypothetical protein